MRRKFQTARVSKEVESREKKKRKEPEYFDGGGGEKSGSWRLNSPKELQAIRQQGGDRPCLIGARARKRDEVASRLRRSRCLLLSI